MNLRVTAQIQADAFRSEWDDPVAAGHAFCRFAEDVWRGDLTPLEDQGVSVEVLVQVNNPANGPAKGLEVQISPYEPQIFDMMRETRQMLTDQQEVWDRWTHSDAARRLYRG